MDTAALNADRTEGAAERHVDSALLVLRIVLGIVFMVHGSQLVFGAFGGPGLAGIAKQMGPIGYLVAIGQFFGGLGLVVGVLTRFSAAAIGVIMLGAIGMVHLKNGFFMNWFGKQAGEGYEYHLLVIAMCVVLIITGPGRYAVQAALPGALRKL